jgi:phosphatidylserine/phosphatidylglycerophosphate/cardiolipin synthase-like enzyme
MKNRTIKIVLLTMAVLTILKTTQLYSQEGPPSWEVHFSPRGGCTEAIISALNQAKKTILIQAYSFTSEQIAKALTNAHKRGVKIQVILDKSQHTEKYSGATFLANTGITVLIDSKHAKAHNKVMIIDEELVITGSFNFTKAAEQSNAENLLLIRDGRLAEIYTKNFDQHKTHSDVYRGRGR